MCLLGILFSPPLVTEKNKGGFISPSPAIFEGLNSDDGSDYAREVSKNVQGLTVMQNVDCIF